MPNDLHVVRLVALLAPLLSATPVAAQDAEVVSDVIACRAVANDAERLACFDRTTSLLADARSRNEVRVEDPRKVEEAKRAQFGLTPAQVAEAKPKPAPQAARKAPPEPAELREISSSVARVSRDGLGRYVVTLADGARWRQKEAGDMREPRPGDPIRIRRAALGSFMANIKNERAVRVERLPN